MTVDPATRCDLSIVIPAFNEAESIRPLTGRLLPVLKALGTHEVIFVDDGSTDGTGRAVDAMQAEHPGLVKAIHLRTNCGKSVALQAGFDASSGKILVMMDADLQDQPEEVPRLVRALRENGLDAVTGWKADRRDPFVTRLLSGGFNMMVRWMSGIAIHDFNCGLKAFYRDCTQAFFLYGQLHRFVLVFIAEHGFKVGEVEVGHVPRPYGRSKYGMKRVYHGFMDLLTVFFITRYLGSPLYFFGFYGTIAIAAAVPTGAFFVGMHFLSFVNGNPAWRLGEHPLWILSPVLFLIGVVMIFFGLLGELVTYHIMFPKDYAAYVRKDGERPRG
ncbi:MAG: glycosyltransferase family 2 protein [Elusimicrobia bacterium]|nr:glycosyltransferase family 2 protein [Elusimicrobiota bacterium]